MKIGTILLAGGASSRLGIDKAWLKIEGETLLQRVVSNVDFLDNEIVIVTAAGRSLPEVQSDSKLKKVEDMFCGRGPLKGIYTGLMHSSYQHNLVLACDMPFVNRKLVRYMIDGSTGYDIVIPRIDEYNEPLHAVYSRTCLKAVEDLFARGEWKIDRLLSQVRVRYITQAEIEEFDPRRLSFFNINRSADVEEAIALLKGENRDS